MSALWDRELNPPPEWPLYRGPKGRVEKAIHFSLRLPRGWEETPSLSGGASFAATSPDRCALFEFFIAVVEKGRYPSAAKLLAQYSDVTLEGLREEHPDVKEIWRGEGGTVTGGACYRQIVTYTEANGLVSTTDYFYMTDAETIISANFKVLALRYEYWASAFERITRGISVEGLGPPTIFPRHPCPMAACDAAPTGWIRSHCDPFALSYPSEWQEVRRDNALFPGATELTGPDDTRFVAMFCDSKWEGKSCEGLFYLADGIHGALRDNEADARLLWQGEVAQVKPGRCIRAIYRVPHGVRPTTVRDMIILGSNERAIILQFNTREANYTAIVPIFEAIARTAVVGPLGPFTINSRKDEM
jgi:hypothetical protein